ncbi:MAG TPA: FHA domain-containing protein [Anaeromyxobacteraceae bacterium]|nr:FHA domain-containing protein [Anaeromyxobacteraceae bacterium]
MDSGATCPRCGRDNDPAFAFCHACGEALRQDDDRECGRCGAKLPASFRFCGHCGQAADAAPRRSTSPGSARLPPLPSPDGGSASGAPPAPAAAPGPAAPPGPVAARPSAPAPRLVLVRHDGQPGASHLLDREVTICGRRDGDVLLPEDGSVSPRHAAVTVRDGCIRVEDLGSAGGTFVRLRAPRSIHFGDEIRLGRQLLRLEPMPHPPATAAPGVPWGSADPGYRARLVQLLEGGGTGEVIPLRAGTNAVGRETGEVSFPGDRYVSGRHARIDVGEGAVTLTDLGSSNGTFLRIAGPTEIGPGDQVLVGMQLLRVEA